LARLASAPARADDSAAATSRVAPMTPEEFGKLVATETEKWAKVVKAANLSVD
jgi:hypothetical protein